MKSLEEENEITKSNGKSIIFTSNILSSIYSLTIDNLESFNKGICNSSVIVNNTEQYVGICDNNNQMYILDDEEMLIMEILLSWNALVDLDEEQSEILFEDIDYIRKRNKDNRLRVKENHLKYLNIFDSLNKLYFVYTNKPNEIDNNDVKFKLFQYEMIYENSKQIGIKYDFGRLGQLMKTSKQMVELNTNIFDIRISEIMNYKIIRYLISSIYMNRIKGKSFTRTHKSILNAITYNENGKVIRYYDSYSKNRYVSKYLKRYLERLVKTLEVLKQCNFICDYSIEKIDSRQELVMGCGKVTFFTNGYKKKRKRGTFLSQSKVTS